MQNYCTVLDVWEGSLEVNEAEFAKGGIAGLIVRLNDTQGGLHMDANFLNQWGQSQAFNPAPYFVYNPWVSGQANYTWLLANMPTCPAVFIDTELHEAGTTPAAFGVQYNAFMALCRAKWKTIIYTGAWFLEFLAPWPKDLDYWWAAYPYSMYPPAVTSVTWDQLKTKTDALAWPPYNSATCPGPVKMWQCSGDRLIVPGSTRAMDISVFPGTVADYRAWLGYGTPIPSPLTLEDRVARLEKAAVGHGWTL
jgi:hypothetical protein